MKMLPSKDEFYENSTVKDISFLGKKNCFFFPEITILNGLKKVIVTLLFLKELNFTKVLRDCWHGVSFPWLYLSLPALRK